MPQVRKRDILCVTAYRFSILEVHRLAAAVTSSSALDMTDPKLFSGGAPHGFFASLRRSFPVVWTDAPKSWPASVGRSQWNFTRASDIRPVSRQWETYSSARGGIMMDNRVAYLRRTATKEVDLRGDEDAFANAHLFRRGSRK